MLSQRRPGFLAQLDSDPNDASRQFYQFLSLLLETARPLPLTSLSNEDVEDFRHELYLHCTKDKFRVLREYADTGHPFAAYLYVVTHHKALDWLRSNKRKSEPRGVGDLDAVNLSRSALSDPSRDDVGKSVARRELIDKVWQALKTLGHRCRLLIEMAADEYTPREMARVLRQPDSASKKISDDLRYCRRKLKQKLSDSGLQTEQISW